MLWHPVRIANQRQMAIEWARWKYEQSRGDYRFHDGTFTSWSKKRSDEHPHDMWDGVSITAVRNGDPADRWYEAENSTSVADVLAVQYGLLPSDEPTGDEHDPDE